MGFNSAFKGLISKEFAVCRHTKLGHLSSVQLLEVRIGNELRKYSGEQEVRHDLSPNRPFFGLV